MKTIICPSVKKRSPGQRGGLPRGDNNTNWSYWWGNFGKSYAEGSYTISSWMQHPKGSYYEPKTSEDWNRYFLNFANANSDVPLYGDGNWVDAWPRATDPAPPDYSGKHTDNGMRRMFVNRHDFATNLGYADGHVARAALRGLWDQEWHVGYVLRSEPRMPKR